MADSGSGADETAGRSLVVGGSSSGPELSALGMNVPKLFFDQAKREGHGFSCAKSCRESVALQRLSLAFSSAENLLARTALPASSRISMVPPNSSSE